MLKFVEDLWKPKPEQVAPTSGTSAFSPSTPLAAEPRLVFQPRVVGGQEHFSSVIMGLGSRTLT